MAQKQVLRSGDYIWPWDDFDPEYSDEDEAVPRPTTLAEPAAANETGEFWGEGTHTILGIDGPPQPARRARPSSR